MGNRRVTNLRFDLDPTITKVVLIALLLFAEGIALSIYAILLQQRYPTVLEIVTFSIGAFIQLVTYFLTFLRTGELPKKETETNVKSNSPS